MRRLFVAQELLDQWSDQGKIELSGNYLKILAEDRSFQLQPGAHFLSLAAGQDTNNLVGKVKSEDQLRELGGELYMNSVLLGEDAYDVRAGFLAEVADMPVSAPAPAKAKASDTRRSVSDTAVTAAAPQAPSKQDDEKASLAKFLLENLT
jgi:hypothetical protein